MLRPSARGALLLAAGGALLWCAACGKKAPLRLVEDRVAERAPALRASVREGRVTLDFRVPAHRFFPEREQPWVLARILRQAAGSSDVVEAGAILRSGGFAFDAALTWSDRAHPPKSSFVYRVEFRDAVRRRRALSEPLTVAWEQLPGAPSGLSAVGHLRSIILDWTAPAAAGAGVGYRIYRREPVQEGFQRAAPDPVAANHFVDSRIETDRDYCYVVRAVLTHRGVEAEGPASPESCSRALAEPPPQPPAGAPD